MSDKEKILQELKELAPNSKISCTDARKLAEKLNINPRDIGEACDEAGIKIYGCELGCF